MPYYDHLTCSRRRYRIKKLSHLLSSDVDNPMWMATQCLSRMTEFSLKLKDGPEFCPSHCHKFVGY